MTTRNGIVYDLSKSNYIVTVGERIYYFSSAYHRDKFISQRAENRTRINASLSSRFGFDINMPDLADIVLYIKLETRGFRVQENGVEICRNSLVLNGRKINNKI